MTIPSEYDRLAIASRLEEFGITVRSHELSELAKAQNHFNANGNRAMRRAAKRGKKKAQTVKGKQVGTGGHVEGRLSAGRVLEWYGYPLGDGEGQAVR